MRGIWQLLMDAKETCKHKHSDALRLNTGCIALDLSQKRHAGHACGARLARNEGTAIMLRVARKAFPASVMAGGKEVVACLCIVTLL